MATPGASVGAGHRARAGLEFLHLKGSNGRDATDLATAVPALGRVGALAVVVDGQLATRGLDLGHLVGPGGIAVPASVRYPLNHFFCFLAHEKKSNIMKKRNTATNKIICTERKAGDKTSLQSSRVRE